ncbi:helix-turn-helix domain-containing protein [Baekduia sp.]|uniref:helix-turn-helix domain-containing protein n=1 Tax=Baekduia sp. TaxID=2600305 RepID=UPI0039C87A8D
MGAGERPSSDDPLLTADEVASLMRVTTAWVYAESRRNALPHVRLGRYVRFRRSAIERWLDDVQQGPRIG